ncbi:MAG: hypothetical protein LW818_05380 [Ignavibacteriae bacterium]|jgi:hypothetical protein|nr:hypothetical protein [Ignavibacteriota bacterium]
MKTRYLFMILNAAIFIPLLGNAFSTEFHWTLFDYIVALILLNGLGISFFLIRRYIKLSLHQYISFSIALVLFFLIWAELAVGIFDSLFAGS